jgi:hypothetical protein
MGLTLVMIGPEGLTETRRLTAPVATEPSAFDTVTITRKLPVTSGAVQVTGFPLAELRNPDAADQA